jgi:putative ABC transport system permease protein
MAIIRLALRNVVRHGRRSLTIVFLIAAGTAIFVVGNAVLVSSRQGIKTSFVQSLTGDFSVSAETEESFSLFGNEVPIVGEYATTPALPNHDALAARLRTLPNVRYLVSVVSGAGRLDSGAWQENAIFFGVAGPEYLEAFPSISVRQGSFLKDGQEGILLNESQLESIEKATGRRPSLGETIGLSVFSDAGFTIRSLPLLGVFSYTSRSIATDRICLIDVETARALNGYIVGSTVADGSGSPSIDTSSLDDLFSSSPKDVVSSGAALDLSGVEKELRDTSARDNAVRTVSGAWNFVLIRACEGADLPKLGKDIERTIASTKAEARVLDWRRTAGNQAQMIYILQVIFNVGILILAFAVITIVMNSLVITVLERSGEIGMMRAIGASRSYVCRLFVTETLALTFAGALVGVAVGALSVLILAHAGIRLSNSLFVTMFGSSVLRPSLRLSDALLYLVGALFAGALAWIHPVRLVLHSQPIQAMAKAEE